MNKFIHVLLDQVAERVSALITRLVASHIEVRCAEHQAELSLRVEELASTYEDNGQDEIAARLRSATTDLFSNTVAPTGEAVLNYAHSNSALPAPAGRSGTTSATGSGKGRRGGTRRISADTEHDRTEHQQTPAPEPELPLTTGTIG